MCANSRNVIEIAISFVYRTKQKDKVVCGFSSMERMALVNVEGSGLVGIKGVDKRIFGVLEYPLEWPVIQNGTNIYFNMNSSIEQ